MRAGAHYSLWTIRLAAHQRPGWEPARPLTGMVNQAQRAGRRPLGNVQCGRSTQENREVLVVEVSRGSPEGGTVEASMARGFRAAVDPRHQPGGLWPAPWESQPFPWASTARNANGTPRFPALGWADAPGERVARFPFPPPQTIETSLRRTTCSPAVTPFAAVSGPVSDTLSTEMLIAEGGRLFE